MNHYIAFSQNLTKDIPRNMIHLNEMMKEHTHFRLGGPADIMVIPENRAQLMRVLELAKEHDIPFFIMGNGSNIIVRDGGIRGLVIKLEKLNQIQVTGDRIIAESGAEIMEVSRIALEHSLTGLEFACGIPGSVGGAVFMNAGAYGGEMGNVLESVLVITPEGELCTMMKEELELAYRSSLIKTKGLIVLEATLKLVPADQETIAARMQELERKRQDRQPLDSPSAGSTFKRPEGHFAGQLIQEAGLRGYSIGGAAVSPIHCGFIINQGDATAADVLELIRYVQQVVLETSGVRLDTEVLVVGEDLP